MGQVHCPNQLTNRISSITRFLKTNGTMNLSLRPSWDNEPVPATALSMPFLNCCNSIMSIAKIFVSYLMN